MRIALDFDSVLSDTMVSWVKIFNSKKGTKYTKEHVTQWEFWDDFGIEKEEAIEIFHESWQNWDKLQPTEDSLEEKTKKLSNLGTVDVVSNVENEHVKSVENWLDHHNISYSSFVKSNHDKEKLEYDYYIDDDPRLAEKLTALKKPCFVYDQKWNEHLKNPLITRVSSVSEVIDFLS